MKSNPIFIKYFSPKELSSTPFGQQISPIPGEIFLDLGVGVNPYKGALRLTLNVP
jgi:hypothetical protein